MIVFRRLVIFMVLSILPTMLYAQVDTLRFNKYYAGKYWSDTKKIASAPFHWDGNEWTKAALYTGITASVMLFDDDFRDISQDFRSWSGETGENISAHFVEPFGEVYAVATIGLCIAGGILADDSKSISTGLLSIESFLLASAIVRAPKYMFGRVRPNNSEDGSQYHFEWFSGNDSFPSGHTIAIFSVASVIANQYSDIKWVPIATYAVAGLVGVSRVYDNRHWASDVVASAFVGTLIGNLVCGKVRSDKVAIIPFQNNSIKGVELAFKI